VWYGAKRANVRWVAYRLPFPSGADPWEAGASAATTWRSRQGVAVPALTPAQIRDGAGNLTLPATIEQEVVARTPLWFYILHEAELNGGGLSGVGRGSWRRRSSGRWRAARHRSFAIPRSGPTWGPDPNTFRMVDLLLFAFEGDAVLLNPNGP